jgi:hypothetical protein
VVSIEAAGVEVIQQICGFLLVGRSSLRARQHLSAITVLFFAIKSRASMKLGRGSNMEAAGTQINDQAVCRAVIACRYAA